MQTDVSDLAAFRAANPRPLRDVVAAPEVIPFSLPQRMAREIARAEPMTPLQRHQDAFYFSGTPFTALPPSQVNVTLGKMPPWKSEREDINSQLNMALTILQTVDSKLKSPANRAMLDDAMRLLRQVRNEF